MKRLHLSPALPLTFILSALFVGCEEFLSVPWFGLPGQSVTSYPAQVGNRWEYRRTGYFHNIRLVDTTVVFIFDTIRATSIVEIIAQTNLPANPGSGDFVTVSVFRQIENEVSPPGPPIVSYAYLQMAQNVLWMHGYAGGTLAVPRPHNDNASVVLNGQTFASIDEMIEVLTWSIFEVTQDTIQREIPPLKSIQYPLQNGRQWTFRPAGRPWRIDKRTGPLRIGTRAGATVRYHELRWLYDIDGNGQWDQNIMLTDEVSSKGLVNRRIDIMDFQLIGPGGEPLGYFDFRDEYTITSMHVP